MASDVIELVSPVIEAVPCASVKIRNEPRASRSLAAKRALDVVLALFLLLLALPMLLMVALAVMADGGPVFYGHRRVGRGGRGFDCLKFRTMRVDADAVLESVLAADEAARFEWETKRKLRRDPRVTRAGRFLRASSLDELPQLFNVIAGDMSLVGPRPVVQAELDQYYVGEAKASYLSVRPGVTGLWQVSGRSETAYAERVALDCAYVRCVSLTGDLVLLGRTVGALLRRSGAY